MKRNVLRNPRARCGALALVLGGLLLSSALSSSTALAQYYPPSRYGYDPGYPPGYVPRSYEPYDPYRGYRRYDRGYDSRYERGFTGRRDETYRRRPQPADDDAPARPKKAKQERLDEPKAASDKPVKGPYTIVVSIDKQRVSLYGSDGLIRTSGVSTGMRGRPTPMGVFTVLGKEIFHRSNLYSNAPMPFMQRITWSGVALHEGVLPGYPASHGCIRLSKDFAVFLWGTTKVGARVIVAHDEAAPAEISHANLFGAPSDVRVAAPVAASGDGKMIAAASKSLIAVIEDPGLAVMLNDAPVTVAETRFAKPKIDAYRNGPVSVFVSRKTGKLYVRYDYEPLFEAPVVIKEPDRSLGTHVYTAMEANGGAMRWSAISIPTPSKDELEVADRPRKSERKTAALSDANIFAESRGNQTASNALDRIEMPAEARARIASLVSVGSSITVSDYGISEETGRETDFVILTK